MLVLTRCLNDAIRIGNDIRVKVLGIGTRRVMLGIDAPQELRVSREDVNQTEKERTEERTPPRVQLSVLVVEDTPVHAKLIEKALEKFGVAQVVVAPTGEEAIRILARGRDTNDFKPDLVLLDLHLPGLSGFEVLQLMRSVAAFKNTPVVILTSSDVESDVSRCIEAGANAFISKSESYDEFRAAVRRIADFWRFARKVG
ncbi:MAG TPA: response regulator [Phycisphaerae bacterium]|jgi:carbon storage regulator CsrA|nr:response regulator [Phycisphaerae bacterium]HOB76839.1 response regulator [Phycisphaerae bacterium]HOJ56597.1 response regulator [Phycisphaerae bacterium]HOL28375.1 response regulator [Phycisphaerae bacterium]HPP23139.1 response regulator [Phycisphaerae bacterium]